MSLLESRSRPDAAWIAELRNRFRVERTVDLSLTNKLERRASSHAAVADLGELAVLLERFLARRIEGSFSLRNLRALTGGASKEQFVFELDWVCNGEPRRGERMVLRREQAESIVETYRLREFQLVAAMDGVVPVPTAYWLDETGEELLRPAMICGFVQGVQKPAAGTSNVTGIGIAFDADYRAALGPQFVEYLARIHNFDASGRELSAFEIPRIGTTDDIDWQIDWWARVWEEDRLEAVPLMAIAEKWLRAHRQPLDHVSLVHGDYRTGNYLFDDASKKITAILDWELGYFGDRHFDLAWAMMPILRTRAETGEILCSSLFGPAEFLRAYERASGLKVDEDRLRYYTIFAYWKSTVMTLGSGLRAAHGLKTHQDIVLSWFAGLSYPVLEALRLEMNLASAQR